MPGWFCHASLGSEVQEPASLLGVGGFRRVAQFREGQGVEASGDILVGLPFPPAFKSVLCEVGDDVSHGMSFQGLGAPPPPRGATRRPFW